MEKIPSVSEIAKEKNVSEYVAATAIMNATSAVLQQQPKAWKNITEGVIVRLLNAYKCFGNNIKPIISDIVEFKEESIAVIENIIEVADEDILLFNTKVVPDGCSEGGGTIYEDTDTGRSIAVCNVTLLRSPNYCLFIDREGFDYCRYVGVLEYNYETMYKDIINDILHEKEQIELEKLQQEDLDIVKKILEYKRRCARWEGIMQGVDESDTRKAKATQRKNVLAMLHSYFPGQKFSVTYEICWSHTLKIKWIDGPTEEEVLATDIDLFQRGTIHFDGMTDSTEIEEMKNSNFAREYALYINDIELDREMSEQTKSELEADVESVWPDGVYDGALVADNPQLYKTVEALGFSPNEICFDWLYKETITRKLFDRLSMYV